MSRKHCFVICAYQNSPYLEECILSLKGQEAARSSGILLYTATPCREVRELADKYDIPMKIGESERGKVGIAADWNSAICYAREMGVRYVTLAHQDDVYEPDYAKCILTVLQDAEKLGERPQIAFTDYYEIRKSGRMSENTNLCIKQILLAPLKSRQLRHITWTKRLAICFGNAICCPAVTYVLPNLEQCVIDAHFDCMNLFHGTMGSNIDWQLWEELSRERGSFLYLPKKLMGHRIHEDSTTSELIRDERRRREDLYMLEKFWPKWIAEGIEHFYQRAEKSNSI